MRAVVSSRVSRSGSSASSAACEVEADLGLLHPSQAVPADGGGAGPDADLGHRLRHALLGHRPVDELAGQVGEGMGLGQGAGPVGHVLGGQAAGDAVVGLASTVGLARRLAACS